MKNVRSFLILAAMAGMVLWGCQKKVTKVETPPPEPKPPVVETVPVKPVEDFTPVVDLDAELRNILQTIYFDYDKYTLRSDAISKLEAIARYLQQHPTVRVLAEGHCDERGSSEYNMGLGENRAKAVKKYLTSYGIDAGKVETTSYGKERLMKMGCGSDDMCHEGNRRVDWQVLAK
ncbi:MAG: OmpA family protein [Chitinispirillaceae bacterium]|nr:OmpA family protein [Chitinispirillaceae bacterium]